MSWSFQTWSAKEDESKFVLCCSFSSLVCPSEPHQAGTSRQLYSSGHVSLREPSLKSHPTAVVHRKVSCQESLSMLAKKRWAHHSSRSMGTKPEKKKKVKNKVLIFVSELIKKKFPRKQLQGCNFAILDLLLRENSQYNFY